MIDKTFATKIKELRLSLSLSQEQMGQKVNLTQRKVSKLEKLETSASLENVVEYARFFGVTTDYLLGLED